MADKNLSKRPQDKHTWMVAYVTNNLGEAQIVAGRLQSEGIPAMLDHMAGMSAIGLTIGRWGEVKVLVHPQNYELTLAILFPDEPDELPEGDGDNIIYYDDWTDEEDNDDE